MHRGGLPVLPHQNKRSDFDVDRLKMAKKKLLIIDETDLLWLLLEEDTPYYNLIDGLDLDADELCIWQEDMIAGMLGIEFNINLTSQSAHIESAWQNYDTTCDLLAGDHLNYSVLAQEERKLIHAIKSYNFARRLSLALSEGEPDERGLLHSTDEGDKRPPRVRKIRKSKELRSGSPSSRISGIKASLAMGKAALTESPYYLRQATGTSQREEEEDD